MNGLHNKGSSKGIEIRAKINEINSYGINKNITGKTLKVNKKYQEMSQKLKVYLTNAIKIDSQWIIFPFFNYNSDKIRRN